MPGYIASSQNTSFLFKDSMSMPLHAIPTLTIHAQTHIHKKTCAQTHPYTCACP